MGKKLAKIIITSAIISLIITLLLLSLISSLTPSIFFYEGMQFIGGSGGCPDVFYDNRGQKQIPPFSGIPPLYFVSNDILSKYINEDEIRAGCPPTPDLITSEDALLGETFYPISFGLYLDGKDGINILVFDQNSRSLNLGRSTSLSAKVSIEDTFDNTPWYIPFNPEVYSNVKFDLEATSFDKEPKETQFQPLSISKDVQQDWIIQPNTESVGEQTVKINFVLEDSYYGNTTIPAQKFKINKPFGINTLTSEWIIATFFTLTAILSLIRTIYGILLDRKKLKET